MVRVFIVLALAVIIMLAPIFSGEYYAFVKNSLHKAIAMLNYQGVSGLYFHCSSFDFNIRLYNITLCVQSTNYGTGHDL